MQLDFEVQESLIAPPRQPFTASANWAQPLYVQQGTPKPGETGTQRQTKESSLNPELSVGHSKAAVNSP